MKILNLYAGIGGNRKFWENVKVTAVEYDKDIAKIYKDFHPQDEVIVGDAHKYLEEHFAEYDFIWSSPPCPSHSCVRKVTEHQNKPIFPDMKLYEEIIFLKHYFKGKWCVENVVSYYEPLIKPHEIAKHYFWSNFYISPIKCECREHDSDIETLQKLKGFDLSNYRNIDKRKILRNCVEPKTGLHILNDSIRDVEPSLFR